MKQTAKKLIIVLNGGFIPVNVLESQVKDINNMLADKTIKGQKEIIYLGESFFDASNVIGWYYADTETPVDKMIKFMDKKLPDENSGDEWKNS